MKSEIKKEIEDVLGEGWHVVEETAGTLPTGIIKLRTPKGKIVYAKGVPCKINDEITFGFEFLSASDCVKLGIAIEETYGEALEGLDDKNYEVDESHVEK